MKPPRARAPHSGTHGAPPPALGQGSKSRPLLRRGKGHQVDPHLVRLLRVLGDHRRGDAQQVLRAALPHLDGPLLEAVELVDLAMGVGVANKVEDRVEGSLWARLGEGGHVGVPPLGHVVVRDGQALVLLERLGPLQPPHALCSAHKIVQPAPPPSPPRQVGKRVDHRDGAARVRDGLPHKVEPLDRPQGLRGGRLVLVRLGEGEAHEHRRRGGRHHSQEVSIEPKHLMEAHARGHPELPRQRVEDLGVALEGQPLFAKEAVANLPPHRAHGFGRTPLSRHPPLGVERRDARGEDAPGVPFGSAGLGGPCGDGPRQHALHHPDPVIRGADGHVAEHFADPLMEGRLAHQPRGGSVHARERRMVPQGVGGDGSPRHCVGQPRDALGLRPGDLAPHEGPVFAHLDEEEGYGVILLGEPRGFPFRLCQHRAVGHRQDAVKREDHRAHDHAREGGAVLGVAARVAPRVVPSACGLIVLLEVLVSPHAVEEPLLDL
mmetsp:Transcript_26084/g.66382  ORF Transcript_26084/g.66382 Transcript_26084/m.66382 type:complete len:491 (-) Transcript_26084:411-1883(-)